MYQKCTAFFYGCKAFSEYTYEDHRICTALEKMYILVQTPLSMKLRAKDNVPKMYNFFLSLHSFSMIVQLFNDCTAFKNIHMRTTEFVQLWKKLYILVQTPLSLKFMSQGQCTKDVQLFPLVVQLFKNIHMRTTEFVQLFEKTVHFGANTIVNEIKSHGQCTKDVQLFSSVVQLFNGSTAS